jgi:hypothetical protein
MSRFKHFDYGNQIFRVNFIQFVIIEMKRELFLILLLIIGILLWKYSVETEEFKDFVMPKPNPQPSPVAKGDPSPFAPPSTSLLAPPPGQTASVNSYPADDPAQQKANAKRIKGLLETLNGFLSNEGPGLSELGDPAVQIPLQTARADARRLTDEVSVLDRNPGVESTLSETNVYDIEANLTYLQKKWRLSANSMSGSVEGFQGGPSGSPSGNPSGGPSGSPSGGPSVDSSGTPTKKATSDSASITVEQLKTLQINISATITRLTNSGSTNPLLQQRVNVLEKVLQSVNSYVTEVNRGTIKPGDIPISVGSYNKFLPFVDPTKGMIINDPLPNLIATTGASPALSNLFPYLFGGDVSGVDLARSLFEKYAKSFFNNTSYEVGLKFKRMSDAELNIAENVALAALNPLRNSYGSDSDDYYGSESRKDGSTHGTAPKSSGSRGETETRTTTLSGSTDGKTAKSHVSTSANPGAASSTPATMDWKARSEQICSQISKRGLDPNDYGCLKNPRDVDENFSFRGHARMVCSRLGTNYDPGIPDLCGCPPPTWPGWRP